MSDTRLVIRATMKAMIERFGCYDAVAELLNARWGGGHSKGTISKKTSGALDFTVLDVLALEDALGEYPVTRMLARRMAERPEHGGSLLAAGGLIAKEAGEAVAAVLAAAQSAGAREQAQAVTEIDEAIAALRRARALIEGEAE